MTRLFHSSDWHISFKPDGSILKPMDKRVWSIGSPNYVGYIDKILEFNKTIEPTDILVITGDLGHDINHNIVATNLAWIDGLNGIKIICRGNHDRNWDFAQLRLTNPTKSTYMMVEGETLAIGDYLFGCWSEHDKKQEDPDKPWYSNSNESMISVATRIVSEANRLNKVPALISHYPPPQELKEVLGKIGIEVYLSGHVHCSLGSAPNGTDWTWYNKAVLDIDDKVINGCFYSTGTTDVLLQKHAVIIKEITKAEADVSKIKLKVGESHHELKKQAEKLLNAPGHLVADFKQIDPFNPKNTVRGFISRNKGLYGGSLVITHVNDDYTGPQLIYGTPKLKYPYKDGSNNEYIEFKDVYAYTFATKMNGVNILAYRYRYNNHDFTTFKTKGAPFVNNSVHGNFFDLLVEFLNRDTTGYYMEEILRESPYQSISYELYGTREPHLVKYNVGLDMRELFCTKYDGTIVLGDVDRNDIIPFNTSEILEAKCKISQRIDRQRNDRFREERNLPLKYEYNHFANEGQVLYLLNEKNEVINRTLYKIKPSDIEEVHWQSFEKDVYGRVIEAYRKLGRDNLPINLDSITKELDMGPKEANKWSRSIKKIIDDLPKVSNAKVIIMVGLPGSGKSTTAARIADSSTVIINQDTVGSRKKCKEIMSKALEQGKDVIVDRVNFDVNQRKSWIELAKQFNVKEIIAIVLDVPNDVCLSRAKARVDHPTIGPEADAESIISSFSKLMIKPDLSEGFNDIRVLTLEDQNVKTQS